MMILKISKKEIIIGVYYLRRVKHQLKNFGKFWQIIFHVLNQKIVENRFNTKYLYFGDCIIID